jgi:polyisoprenoid-binding protein YceI
MALAAVLSVALPDANAQSAPAAPVAAQSAETKWVVDMVHSQVAFGVRHLVGQVRGTFGRWYAVISTKEGDWKLGTVNVTVQTASLNTGNGYRDDDSARPLLRWGRYPTMTFKDRVRRGRQYPGPERHPHDQASRSP